MEKDDSVCDVIENKTLKIIKSFGLFLLLMFWGVIPIIFLKILNIDYEEMDVLLKVLISLVNDICLLIIFISIYRKIFFRDFKNYFFHNFTDNFKKSFLMWLMGFGIMVVSNVLIAYVTGGQIAKNEEAVRELIDMAPLYMAFQVMIYAPITEELIFRKSIKDFISNKWLYVIVSGLLFGGVHVISSLGSNWGFLYLIPYCSLGMVFAHLYYETDNIFSTITIHSIHNTLAILLYLSVL